MLSNTDQIETFTNGNGGKIQTAATLRTVTRILDSVEAFCFIIPKELYNSNNIQPAKILNFINNILPGSEIRDLGEAYNIIVFLSKPHTTTSSIDKLKKSYIDLSMLLLIPKPEDNFGYAYIV